MKKFLLSILALAAVCTVASAREASINFGQQGWENTTEHETVAINADITLTFGKGTNSNTPKYYTTGTAMRLYGGNTLTFTGAEGVTITGVTFTTGTSNLIVATSTVDNGTLTAGATPATWTGSANSFTLTEGGTSGHARIQTITVTYDGGTGGEAPVNPDPVVPTGSKFEKAGSITSGSKYLLVIDNAYGAMISATATYGRLNLTTATFTDGAFYASESNALTLTEVAGKGYTIVDSENRYYGMDDSHFTSFQIYTEANDGCYWTAAMAGSTITLTNVLNPTCVVCRSTGTDGTPYTNIAPAVAAEGQTLPELYLMTEAGGEQPTPDPVDPVTPDDAKVYFGLSEDATSIDWTFDNVVIPEGGTYVWSWKSYNSKQYLNASGYVGSAQASEAWAVSPAIDLVGWADVTMNFDHAAKFQTTLKELCGLYIRENGTTTWTELTIPEWPVAGGWTFANSGNINLAAWQGKVVQLGFKYASTTDGADTWEIKNLKVNGSKSTGIEAIEAGVDTPAAYYTVQGIRVANPTPGNLYIVVKGNKAEKTYIR